MNMELSTYPSISVIMPVYNAGKFLSEAVESILNQSYKDFEFIIVNDGSEDNSSAILQSFSDERIQLIERENRGFAATLNEAISVSRGRYIARMDADDIALVNRLKMQYEFMEETPGLSILGGQAWVIDENGIRVGEIRKPTSSENIAKYIRFACPLIHPTYFVRSDVYKIDEPYRPMLPPVEDYDFLFRSLERGCVLMNLSEKVLEYRRNTTGMSSQDPQRTIIFTSKVKQLHHYRTNKNKTEDKTLSYLASYNKGTSRWFKTVYEVRNYLLTNIKSSKGIKKILLILVVILVSVFHFQILDNTYNSFRSLYWNN